MRLRDALKLHNGDEVTLKSTGESCKVDTFHVTWTIDGSKPYSAEFSLHASKQGYIRSIRHTEFT